MAQGQGEQKYSTFQGKITKFANMGEIGLKRRILDLAVKKS